jgi:hypothetical protein
MRSRYHGRAGFSTDATCQQVVSCARRLRPNQKHRLIQSTSASIPSLSLIAPLIRMLTQNVPPGISKPGAICLSEDAYRQVKARLDLSVRDLG